jgi:putative PIN family toxin of toxin-antitoxin system
MRSSEKFSSKLVVIDVNIFLAFIVFESKISETILDLWLVKRDVRVLYNDDLIDELTRKLLEFNISHKSIILWINRFKKYGVYKTQSLILNYVDDPKDNYLIEFTQAAKADYLITRDKDLLRINKTGNWDSTRILTPELFCEYLRTNNL